MDMLRRRWLSKNRFATHHASVRSLHSYRLRKKTPNSRRFILKRWFRKALRWKGQRKRRLICRRPRATISMVLRKRAIIRKANASGQHGRRQSDNRQSEKELSERKPSENK